MAARLTVYARDGSPSRHLLVEPGPCTLGRDPQADILVDDPRVSRQHLLFSQHEGHWRAQDLGSKNGTRLDGRPMVDAALPEAAWLSLGGVPAAWVLTDEVGQLRDSLRRQTAFMLQRPLETWADAEGLLAESLRGMVELSEASAAFLWLREDAGQLQLHDQLGSEETVSPSLLAFRDRAFNQGELLVEPLAPSGTAEEGVRIGLPMVLADRLLGGIVLDGGRARASDSPLDREVLVALASQAALAAAVSRLRSRIRALGHALPGHARDVGRDPGLRRLLRQVFPAYRQQD